MTDPIKNFALLVTRLVVLLAGATLAAQQPDSLSDDATRGERLFALHIRPLLAQKCLSCHGDDPKKIKGGLDLRTRASALRGGETSKRVVVPGDADASLLYQAVRWVDEDLEMPPKENDRLTAVQIRRLHDWLQAGAPWPDARRQKRILAAELSRPVTEDGALVRTSGGLDQNWTHRRYRVGDLWSFRPLSTPEVPVASRPKSAVRAHPIDAFVDRKLRAAGQSPAPYADRRTLIRRATYDLWGLPPTLKEITAFVDDRAPGAWKRVIDSLLASPRYGEQWGRHWLDVVRYADTSGYSNDYERSNAWRYRDYVIRSFNADKPYDRFVIEQIAGDELRPRDPEMKVAVGFLRMGPWEHTGMAVPKETRQLWLDDVTNSVGEAFLSTPMRCCKCHDHKFDPLPTRDYYRLQAVFATTQPAELNAAFLDDENRGGFVEGEKRIRKLLAWAQADVAKIKAKEERAARAWCTARSLPYVLRKSKKARALPEDQKPPRHIGLDYHDQGFLKVREQDARIWTRRLERYQPLAQSVYNGPDVTRMSTKLRRAGRKKTKGLKPAKTFILAGGSVHAPAAAVLPGVLSAVPASYGARVSGANVRVPQALGGRRLALARWIASADNPLAMRSIVNRVWGYHLGRGIAANPNNFGKTGAKPTHPELLDWLARRFSADGFSIKALHRLIMTSATYRRSGKHPAMAELRRKDPGNELLAYFEPRRLSAEELRDTMLAVAGELDRGLGGLPVFPEINFEVALQPRMLQFSLAPAYQPSRTAAERNRRSIYVYRMRGQADPMLEVFNQPRSEVSCERRDTSNVTPQVFAMMNSAATTDRSIAMALRLEREADTLPERVALAFQLALGRAPRAFEQSRMVAYVREMVTYHRAHPPALIEWPKSVERSVVEEMSGLAFDYTERLDRFEDYVPSAKPFTVSAEIRALADLGMVLLNSNEFFYVY
jgi:mono/diheme cytochrome c family protein